MQQASITEPGRFSIANIANIANIGRIAKIAKIDDTS
jgi:hypothetical protein